MSLFSKEKCSVCGIECWLGIKSFDSCNGKVLLCQDCIQSMNVVGYLSYNHYIGKKQTTYSELKNYQASYMTIKNNRSYIFPLSSQRNAAEFRPEAIFYEIGSLCINYNYIAISSYDDLIINTSDVFAITFDSIREMSTTSADVFRISFFTNNPYVPFFSTIVAGKIGFFSLSLNPKNTELPCRKFWCRTAEI